MAKEPKKKKKKKSDFIKILPKNHLRNCKELQLLLF